MTTLIEAAGLRFSYGSTPVLDIAEFRVDGGESVAVRGRSGSGKSTLLHCLAGLQPPDSGVVRIDGTDLYELEGEHRLALRRRSYGFVFQHHLLLDDLPLVENVALPLMLSGSRRSGACEAATVVMAELGIRELAKRFPGEVSGGEGQRAAVARALVHRPLVIVADEPTGALDSGNASAVMQLLLEGVDARGAALVLVTHDSSVARLCDRVVTLDDGRIVD